MHPPSRRPRTLLAAFVATLALALPARAATLYVDGTSGNDQIVVSYNGSGTFANGAFFEDGTFDRILCLYGAASYAEHLDAMIFSYGKLLKKGGLTRSY